MTHPTRLFVAAVTATLTAVTAYADEATSRVAVIGIDGVRPDALIVADTPNIDRLIANGTFDPRCLILGERYRENNTVSGASWSSILTGTWADKHGVHDNSFDGRNYDDYPHFFHYIKAADPDAKTISVTSVWPSIDRHIVSDADIRHHFALPGSTADLHVPAEIDTRDGQWHHLLGMRRGETLYLYLNGEKAASLYDNAGAFDLDGSTYHIGRDARSGRTLFEGELRDVRLWSRALDESEIQSAAAGEPVDDNQLLHQIEGPIEREQLDIESPLQEITQGDFTVAAAFRTSDDDRNILMGNFGDADRGHLNLELHTDNHIRLYLNPPRNGEDRMVREYRTDTAATDKVVELLGETDPTAMWIYLHHPDAAGHGHGFSPLVPEYMDAIESIDEHIGRIVEAIESRPSYDDEDWLIVMTTDHGGIDTRHGGGHDVPEILHGFMLVSGDAAANRISPRQSYIVDAVPTALEHLGIEPDERLDGESLGFE